MPSTHIWSCSKLQSHQKGPALTFTSMIGHHITNICEMALHLDLTYSSEWHNSIQARTHPAHNDERFPLFHLGWNHIQLTMMEDFYLGGNTSYSQWWKVSTLSPRLESHLAHNDGILLSRREHILLTMMKGFHSFTQARIASDSQW